MNGIAAFVLSGGKSSRMGSDKALLELGGKSLIARAVELASKMSRDVAIVGDPQKLAGFGRVITDVFPDRGPLGGIHAALSQSSADLNLILAVDLPFL
ncbi:MAG TPA: molybdenum cofactor guanylyltransferase, partial [Terriglobales bacterium]|nr:molybdenum cofactor guanylyltransferase [Terriglobales bacterium]